MLMDLVGLDCKGIEGLGMGKLSVDLRVFLIGMK